MMELRHAIIASFDLLIVASTLVAFTAGIPTSLLDEIKSSDIRNNKVKRAHPVNLLHAETSDEDVPYFNKPSAIKRGVNVDPKSYRDLQWEQDQDEADPINRNSLPNVSSSLFRYPDSSSFEDDKTISDYEKGYRYGTKATLDKALENAVLKSQIYGDSSAINQYGYYGPEVTKKRKRRDAKKLSLQSRYKRELELSPEEVLALLSLYEYNQRQHQPPVSENYRHPWVAFEPNFVENDVDNDQDDESWLESPILPHATGYEKEPQPKYFYNYENKINRPRVDLPGKEQWREHPLDPENKRFMVTKRKVLDPTRELRYLNGPYRNDFYTLSQLLSNQKNSDDGIPVYRRLVL